jgi:hypothetical protein
VDYLAEFESFLSRKNLGQRDDEFIRKQGRAALQMALREEGDHAP